MNGFGNVPQVGGAQQAVSAFVHGGKRYRIVTEDQDYEVELAEVISIPVPALVGRQQTVLALPSVLAFKDREGNTVYLPWSAVTKLTDLTPREVAQ